MVPVIFIWIAIIVIAVVLLVPLVGWIITIVLIASLIVLEIYLQRKEDNK